MPKWNKLPLNLVRNLKSCIVFQILFYSFTLCLHHGFVRQATISLTTQHNLSKVTADLRVSTRAERGFDCITISLQSMDVIFLLKMTVPFWILAKLFKFNSNSMHFRRQSLVITKECCWTFVWESCQQDVYREPKKRGAALLKGFQPQMGTNKDNLSTVHMSFREDRTAGHICTIWGSMRDRGASWRWVGW